jgi:hypothetical protein
MRMHKIQNDWGAAGSFCPCKGVSMFAMCIATASCGEGWSMSIPGWPEIYIDSLSYTPMPELLWRKQLSDTRLPYWGVPSRETAVNEAL